MMEVGTEVTEYVQKETSTAEELVIQAKDLVIQNTDEANGANDWLKDVKSRKRSLEEKRKAIVKPINDSVKQINNLFKRPQNIFDQIEGHIKRSLLDWNRRESDRIKKEKEAEERKAEARRKRFETYARKAEESGDTEKAESFLDKAADVEPNMVDEIEKIEGSSVVKRWKAVVTDKDELVKAIVSGQVSSEAVDPNIPFLNGLARRLKDAVKVPGVRFIEDESISSRR